MRECLWRCLVHDAVKSCALFVLLLCMQVFWILGLFHFGIDPRSASFCVVLAVGGSVAVGGIKVTFLAILAVSVAAKVAEIYVQSTACTSNISNTLWLF